VYDAEHRPRAVELIGGATSAGVSVTLAAAPDVRVGVLARHSRVHLGGALSAQFGTDTMSLHDLIDAALRQDDRDVRADAMRTAVQVLEGDPEFRRALHATPAASDGAPLDDLVRDVGSAHAEEALFYVATKATDSELRNRAVALLDRMHGGSGALD